MLELPSIDKKHITASLEQKDLTQPQKLNERAPSFTCLSQNVKKKAGNGLQYFKVEANAKNFSQLRFERFRDLSKEAIRSKKKSQSPKTKPIQARNLSSSSSASKSRPANRRFSLMKENDQEVAKTIKECIFRMLSRDESNKPPEKSLLDVYNPKYSKFPFLLILSRQRCEKRF